MIIQNTWPNVLLGEVIEDMQPGFAQRPNTDNVGVPQLRTNNVSTDGRIDLSEIKYVKASKGVLEKYGVSKGDVVFNSTNSPELVGKTAYFDSDATFVLSNHMTRVRANPSLIEAEFLARCLHYLWQIGVSSRWAKHWVNQAAIDQAALVQIPVPLPPLPEQARIVDILRQADELRRLRQQARAQTDRLIPALFLEMFGDPDSNPKQWPVIKIESLANPDRPITRTGPFGSLLKKEEYTQTGIPVWGIDNVQANRFVEEGSLFISETKFSELINYEVKDRDVLISRAGTTGRICVARPKRTPSIIGTNLIRVALDTAQIEPDYFTSMLTYFGDRVTQNLRASGEEGSYSFINSRELRNLGIPLADYPLQQAFKMRLEELHLNYDLQEQSQRELSALFDSLLAQAFSGELTAVYRTQHQAELQEAVGQRDIALGLRGQKPHPIDFGQGRVTREEEKQFRQLVQQVFKPAMQDFLASLGTRNVVQSLVEQLNFPTFADLIRPALPTYENLVTNILADSIASIGEVMRASLANHFADAFTETITPLVESVRLSNENFYRSLGQHILALADAQIRQAPQQEPPQPDRAIHAELDMTTRSILQAVQALPTYFTPSELHQLLQNYDHHFDHTQGTDLVQIEAALHLLQTLGFARQVALENRLLYRLVDPIAEGALLPEEIA